MNWEIIKEEARLCLNQELERRDRAEARTRFLLGIVAAILGFGIFNVDLLKYMLEKWPESCWAKIPAIIAGVVALLVIASFILSLVILHVYNEREVPDPQEYLHTQAEYPDLNEAQLNQSLTEMYTDLTLNNSNRNKRSELMVTILFWSTMSVGILAAIFAVCIVVLKAKIT
jgi:hypothetical protein